MPTSNERKMLSSNEALKELRVVQRWASGRHIATCGDRSKISVMLILENDHSEHLKVAICGDRTHFACPPLVVSGEEPSMSDDVHELMK